MDDCTPHIVVQVTSARSIHIGELALAWLSDWIEVGYSVMIIASILHPNPKILGGREPSDKRGTFYRLRIVTITRGPKNTSVFCSTEELTN